MAKRQKKAQETTVFPVAPVTTETTDLPAADFVAPDLSETALTQSAQTATARTERMKELGNSVAESFKAEAIARSRYELRNDPQHTAKIDVARNWRKNVMAQLSGADRKEVNRLASGAAMAKMKDLAGLPERTEGEADASYFQRIAQAVVARLDEVLGGATGYFYLFNPPEKVGEGKDAEWRASSHILCEAYEYRGQTYFRPVWLVGGLTWLVEKIHQDASFMSVRELGASLQKGEPVFARRIDPKEKFQRLWTLMRVMIRAHQRATEQADSTTETA